VCCSRFDFLVTEGSRANFLKCVFLPGKNTLQILGGKERRPNLPSGVIKARTLASGSFLFQSPYSLFRLPDYGADLLRRTICWAKLIGLWNRFKLGVILLGQLIA
jgi:hypothetical protein